MPCCTVAVVVCESEHATTVPFAATLNTSDPVDTAGPPGDSVKVVEAAMATLKPLDKLERVQFPEPRAKTFTYPIVVDMV